MQALIPIVVLSQFSTRTIYGDHDVYAPFELRPLDLQGWGENFPLYKRLIKDMKPELIVEVGVWKGSSTVFMAKELKKIGSGKIVAVDTWLGAIEFWTKHILGPNDKSRDLKLVNGYPSIYYTFLSNVVHEKVQEQVVPMPVPSLLAADFFRRKQLQADIVHIDASHEYSDVVGDLNAWSTIVRKGGVIMGDDYNNFWKGVMKAVDEFVASDPSRKLKLQGNKWVITM